MANYPQLDDCSGVWTLKEVHDAISGGYWRNHSSRGIFSGGDTGSNINVIDFVTLASAGNATDFGNLTAARKHQSAFSSHTRLIHLGGSAPGVVNIMDYITMSTAGNAADFGDISAATSFMTAASNSTRGLRMGGATPTRVNIVEFVTMTTLGDVADFGDLTENVQEPMSVTSPTRAIRCGGYTNPSYTNVMDSVEIATTGNAADFGDLRQLYGAGGGNNSSSTRGFVSGGYQNPSDDYISNIEKVEMSTKGNSIDFGNLSSARGYSCNASNSVRSLTAGGNTGSKVNTIDFVLYTNGGTATDFGDLNNSVAGPSGGSNAHGGLNDGYQGTRP